MGKVIKIVVGVVVMYYAPYLASTYFAGYYFLAMAVISMVGASIIGSAMREAMPDMRNIDQYALEKLKTHNDNYNPIPIVYGDSRLGSTVVFQEVPRNDLFYSDNYYLAIQVVCEGEINEIHNVYGNAEEYTQLGTTNYYHDSDCSGSSKNFVHVYKTSGENGMWLDNVSFLYHADGDTRTGAEMGLTNFHIPPNLCFLAVHCTFENPCNIKIPNFNIHLNGLVSNNGADIIQDILIRELSLTVHDINVPSFTNVHAKIIEYGLYSNIAITSLTNLQAVLQTVLSSFRGNLFFSNGQWYLTMDMKEVTPVYTISDNDILDGSLNIALKGFGEIANKMTIKFINAEDKHFSDKLSITNTDLIAIDGMELEHIINVHAVNNTTQAEKLCEVALNSMRFTEILVNEQSTRILQTPIMITFGTTTRLAHLAVGDIINLDSSLLNRIRMFKILQVETEQSGIIKISAREHCETHFKDENGDYII